MREIECPKCGREYASFPRMGADGLFACPYCKHDALADVRKSLQEPKPVDAPSEEKKQEK